MKNNRKNRSIHLPVPLSKKIILNRLGHRIGIQKRKEWVPWNVKRVLGESSRAYTGKNVKVGVIDTGIDLTHPDLKKNIRGGINILDPSKLPTDLNGHGTHIAGIIGASRNQYGIVGVAPEVSLYAIKVLDHTGVGTVPDLIQGIEWGIANRMDILNISISGGKEIPSDLKQVIDLARKRGVFVVAAAGNEGDPAGKGDTVGIPARIPTVIGVAATDKKNKRTPFSATGSEVDICAPGMNILSTYKDHKYAILSGTSMSAAHVSGVLALYRQRYHGLSYSALLGKLYGRCIPLSSRRPSRLTGWGLVQA